MTGLRTDNDNPLTDRYHASLSKTETDDRPITIF
jgi:hypothetical protein